MLVPGRPFQSRLKYISKSEPTRVKHLSGVTLQGMAPGNVGYKHYNRLGWPARDKKHHNTQPNDTQHNNKKATLSILTLSMTALLTVMLSIIRLSVVTLNVMVLEQNTLAYCAHS